MIKEAILVKTKTYFDLELGKTFILDTIILYDAATGFYIGDYIEFIKDETDDEEVNKYLSNKTYWKSVQIWKNYDYTTFLNKTICSSSFNMLVDIDDQITTESKLIDYPIESEIRDYIEHGYTVLLQKEN